MKSLARLTPLMLCAVAGIALAWLAFQIATPDAVQGQVALNSESAVGQHSRPVAHNGEPHSQCADSSCTACQEHGGTLANSRGTTALPWQAGDAKPEGFNQPLTSVPNVWDAPTPSPQAILQAQADALGMGSQQQNNSLLYTTPHETIRQPPPLMNQQRHEGRAAQSLGNAQDPLQPDGLMGSNEMPQFEAAIPYGPQPLSTLVVRTISTGTAFPQDGQVFPGEGDDKLEIYVNNRDVREVLTLLAEQGGVNILPLPGAIGEFSFAMSGVTVEQALDGILLSTGLIAKREGAFILVGAPGDFEAARKPYDYISTRIYRPDYITATDLSALITPLLTQGISKIQATAPNDNGIPSDAEQAGGNSFADTDAVIVQDYESVLQRIDKIVLEADRRPLQVAIEAMILSVALEDEIDLGVDFEFLRNQGTIRFGLGSPESSLANVSFDDGGLRFAFLDSSLGTFIEALEQIGDTDVIATPRLTVLNKQRAEILIGAQLGYVNTTVTETAATQSVDFLEIGTQLRLRPFIARDGSIRMEIHPELSTGNVRIEGGFTLPDKEVTSVTTNIMVQDGCTIVIGGLMREDLVTNQRQVPYLGSLPWIGALFRSKSESTEKREIVLLVTPRIVHEPEVCSEGEAVACEFHRRQAAVANRMSPLSRDAAARRHFHNAQNAWAAGDRGRALDQVHWSLLFNPQNRAALDLQADILGNRPLGNHTLPPANPHGQLPSPVPPHAHPHQQTEYAPQGVDGVESIPPGSRFPDGQAPAPGSSTQSPGNPGTFPTAGRSALIPRTN